MFLPLGDSPNPPGRPWVTYAIIAVNVAVYLLLLPLSFQAADPRDPELLEYVRTIAGERRLSAPSLREIASRVSRYDLLIFEHGFRPARPSLADVFSSMFLHGGLMHILGNMLFLWIYGDNVEHRLGRGRFLLAYLGTGALACLGDGLVRSGSPLPSVGASGAISGVLGFYFVWFPHNKVRMWVFLFPFLMNVVELPARLVLGFYILFDNLIPVMFASRGGGGVSYGAHIGGFIAGAFIAFLGSRLSQGAGREFRRASAPAAMPAGEAAQAFRQALERGEWEEAARWFFGAPRAATRLGLGIADKVRLGQELERRGAGRAALAAYQRALADHPSGAGRAAAHLGAARVLIREQSLTSAYQHVYAALEEARGEEERAAAHQLLELLAARLRHLPRKRQS